MLVQKQTPKRLKNLLLVGGACIALVAGYMVYVNYSGRSAGETSSPAAARKTVPKDFGQKLFQDPRFYAVTPRPGTELITQTSAVVPADTLPAPSAGQAFDMQTGGTVLFTWKRPAGAEAATILRINRVSKSARTVVATITATQTSFIYRGAPNGEKTQYELSYAALDVLQKVADIPATAGRTQGSVSLTESGSGLQLQWGEFEHEKLTAIEVYRSDEVGAWGQRLARLDPSETSFLDSSPAVGTSFYTVQWVHDATPGTVWATEVTATDATAPEAPSSITATYVASGGFIRVTWSPSASTDVVAYDIFRSASALSLGAKIGSKAVKDVAALEDLAANPEIAQDCARQYCLEDTSFAGGSALPKGIPYYYTAVAIDSVGNQSSTQDLGVAGRSNPFIPL